MADYLPAFRFTACVGPLTIGFRSISGIARWTGNEAYQEGGVNGYARSLPAPSSGEHILRMERGAARGVIPSFFSVGSPFPMPLLILVNDSSGGPARVYSFLGCRVLRWETDSLSADTSALLIDKLEVAYDDFIVLPV